MMKQPQWKRYAALRLLRLNVLKPARLWGTSLNQLLDPMCNTSTYHLKRPSRSRGIIPKYRRPRPKSLYLRIQQLHPINNLSSSRVKSLGEVVISTGALSLMHLWTPCSLNMPFNRKQTLLQGVILNLHRETDQNYFTFKYFHWII